MSEENQKNEFLEPTLSNITNAQWELCGGPYGGSIKCMTINGSNVFAGSDDHGVFLSSNNGASWSAVNNGLTNLHMYSFAVSGTNIFAGTSGGGIFLSTNNGTSWTAVNNGLTN